MSYNITRWNTKSIESLQVHLSAFKDHARKEFHPEITYIPNGGMSLICELSFCDSIIKGMICAGDYLWIDSIDISGEGSGTFFHEVFMPALNKSIGRMKATLIWEGGDSITSLIVADAGITNEEIDL